MIYGGSGWIRYYLISVFSDMDMKPAIGRLKPQICNGIIELDIWKGVADGFVYPCALVTLVMKALEVCL
jgi:hypothetical protein